MYAYEMPPVAKNNNCNWLLINGDLITVAVNSCGEEYWKTIKQSGICLHTQYRRIQIWKYCEVIQGGHVLVSDIIDTVKFKMHNTTVDFSVYCTIPVCMDTYCVNLYEYKQSQLSVIKK